MSDSEDDSKSSNDSKDNSDSENNNESDNSDNSKRSGSRSESKSEKKSTKNNKTKKTKFDNKKLILANESELLIQTNTNLNPFLHNKKISTGKSLGAISFGFPQHQQQHKSKYQNYLKVKDINSDLDRLMDNFNTKINIKPKDIHTSNNNNNNSKGNFAFNIRDLNSSPKKSAKSIKSSFKNNLKSNGSDLDSIRNNIQMLNNKIENEMFDYKKKFVSYNVVNQQSSFDIVPNITKKESNKKTDKNNNNKNNINNEKLDNTMKVKDKNAINVNNTYKAEYVKKNLTNINSNIETQMLQFSNNNTTSQNYNKSNMSHLRTINDLYRNSSAIKAKKPIIYGDNINYTNNSKAYNSNYVNNNSNFSNVNNKKDFNANYRNSKGIYVKKSFLENNENDIELDKCKCHIFIYLFIFHILTILH